MSDNLSPEITCTRCGSPLHLSCGVGEQEPTDDELTIARLEGELEAWKQTAARQCDLINKLLARIPGAK